MSTIKTSRRQFIKAGATLVGSCGVVSCKTLANTDSTAGFTFEVTRTDKEWREMFELETYKVLRHNHTERPKSSKWWNDYREGKFSCIGCGLLNYESVWRVEIDKGWVFFSQSVPNAVLMGIDGDPPSGMADERLTATIEAHCRRCGSHMGHILKVNDRVVHCINGTALDFTLA